MSSGMSDELSCEPDPSAEIAALRKTVKRLLGARGELSLTIPEFCAAEGISRAFFYELKKQGRAPRTMRHGDGCVRISPEARQDWRRAQEAATAGEINNTDEIT
jgi:predicted DNA-binding transcriptional regulator AlpA